MRTKLLAFLLACSAAAAGAETLVLKAGRLIDGRGGWALVPAMVRLEGNPSSKWETGSPSHRVRAFSISARPPCCPGSSTCTPT
jgi:hypothetical protein